jgi:lipopolysaccharide export system protein LptA
MDKLKDAAYRAAGKHFQLNSSQQLSRILYENLKLDQKASIKVKATMSRGAKSTSVSVVHINVVITNNSNILHGSNRLISNGLHMHMRARAHTHTHTHTHTDDSLTFALVHFSMYSTLKVKICPSV